MDLTTNAIVERARKDGDVLAVLLFGSAARHEVARDIDICIVLMPKSYTVLELSKKKLAYTQQDPHYDIQIFQQLPIYVRKRIIAEGQILFCRDKNKLYDLAQATLHEFEHFKPHYERYLEGVAYG